MIHHFKTIGKVQRRLKPIKAQEAKNFPITASLTVTGRVKSNSIVTDFLSSAHNLIETAGTKKRKSHGIYLKNELRSACLKIKKLPLPDSKVT